MTQPFTAFPIPTALLPYAAEIEALVGTAVDKVMAPATTKAVLNAVNIRAFGCKSDAESPNFDNATALQDAINSGESLFIPEGLFWTSGGTIGRADLIMQGLGPGNSIFKALPASNKRIFEFNDCDDVILSKFKIDGNKANQTVGNSLNRGIYATGTFNRWRLEYLSVVDVLDHGIFFSNLGDITKKPAQDSLVIGCYTENVGSAAHIAAGGAGGSGMVGGCDSTVWVGNIGRGDYLNAFKGVGRFISCGGFDCTGGGFESGFLAGDTFFGTTYVACFVERCGNGFRHQGTLDELTMVACRASECQYSGVTVFGDLRRLKILGGAFKNNGQITLVSGHPFNRAANPTNGVDGISFLQPGAAGPTGMEVTGASCFDTQGTATQEFGIYVGDSDITLDLQGPIDAQGNFYGSLYLPTSIENLSISGVVRGYSGQYFNNAAVTQTGGAGGDLMTTTLLANERRDGQVFKVNGTFRVVGTGGTKVIRFNFGASSLVISSQAAGDQQSVSFEATVIQATSVLVYVQLLAYEVGGASALSTLTLGLGSGSDLILKCSCTLGSAADSVIQDLFTVRNV